MLGEGRLPRRRTSTCPTSLVTADGAPSSREASRDARPDLLAPRPRERADRLRPADALGPRRARRSSRGRSAPLKPAAVADLHRILALLGPRRARRRTPPRSCSTRPCRSSSPGSSSPASSPYRPARGRRSGILAAELMVLVYASFSLRKRIGAEELAAPALGHVRDLRRRRPSTASPPAPTRSGLGVRALRSAPSARSPPRRPGGSSCPRSPHGVADQSPAPTSHTKEESNSMSTYRIEIDRSLCSGFGSCVEDGPGRLRARRRRRRDARCVAETDDPAVSTRPAPARWARSPSSSGTGRVAAADRRRHRRRRARRRPLRRDASRGRLRGSRSCSSAQSRVAPYERPAL